MFKQSVWPSLQSLFNKGWVNATADHVVLLICVNRCFPRVCDRKFMQLKKWIPSKNRTTDLIGLYCFVFVVYRKTLHL